MSEQTTKHPTFSEQMTNGEFEDFLPLSDAEDFEYQITQVTQVAESLREELPGLAIQYGADYRLSLNSPASVLLIGVHLTTSVHSTNTSPVATFTRRVWDCTTDRQATGNAQAAAIREALTSFYMKVKTTASESGAALDTSRPVKVAR